MSAPALAGLPSRASLNGRLLHPVLWLTVAAGAIVVYEPSPYEFGFLLLCWAVLIERVPFPRLLAVPLVCLVVMFGFGGVIAALNVLHSTDALRYVVISLYLAGTTVVMAAVVAQDPMERLRLIRSAYIAAALIAASAGIYGYFTGSEFFTLYGRARGTFKDPNVYGPFLIFPALLLIQDMLRPAGARILLSGALLAVILAGLLLSFSRAAWGHFIGSAVVMIYLMLVTSNSGLLRIRVLVGSMLGVMAAAALLAALLTVPEVREVFEIRFASQSYDTGETGRFATQLRSLLDVLESPFGYGAFEYAKLHGQDPHNVYLNSFASYGWLGAAGYIGFVIATWAVGIRFVFRASPWRQYMIAAVATFTVLTLEGFVVDTDHWRHFFLLGGLIWGMAAASVAAAPAAAPQRRATI